ncbi:MAG: hypothetical protein AAB682_01685 [Patescibacteria group bacterium]
MNILLAVTNTRGKSLGFLTDSQEILTLKNAIDVANKGGLENVFLVEGKFGKYLRSYPNAFDADNMDTKSITAADIVAYANHTRHFQSTDAIGMYVAEYSASIVELGKAFIETINGDKAFISVVRDRIKLNASIITQAARASDIDRYLLGAIIIDEIIRRSPFEEIQDKLLLDLLGRNVSVGVAQIKLETANELIKIGLYNPNPDDKKLPFSGNLKKRDREYLYQYVIMPRHNIRFAAAFVRRVIRLWSRYVDLSNRPEIIGTLYHQGYGRPHPNPESNKRGEQIANEFYGYAKEWLA